MTAIPEHKTNFRPHLLMISPLYPPHVGGLESHAQQFNMHMSAAGYSITTWTPHVCSDSTPSEIVSDQLRILRFPAFEIIPNYPVPKMWHPLFWEQYREIQNVIRNLSGVIVISRTRFFLTSLLGLFLRIRFHMPWVHIEHGSDFVHMRSRFLRFVAWAYDQIFGRLVFAFADEVVANSKASAAFVRRLSPHRHVRVIYRGVDMQQLSSITPMQVSSRRVVVYIGRLISGKGVGNLIDAVSKIRDTSFHLLIIGDGPERIRLENHAVALGISDRIQFLGELPWKIAMRYLKAADIFVNPSYTEGLPTSVIEAALCKKAIVATDVGGTVEIIEHGVSGLLVPVGDVFALLKALDRLCGSATLRQSFGAAAYASVSQRFSWGHAIAQYQQVFSSLCAE